MARFAQIVSTGRYLPEIEVRNDALRERFAHLGDFVDKMEQSTGIRQRWHAPEDWATSDLAVRAARQALDARGTRARGDRPDPRRHRLARLHHAGDLRGGAAQAGRAQRGHVRHRLRLRVVPDRPRDRGGVDRGQSVDPERAGRGRLL